MLFYLNLALLAPLRAVGAFLLTLPYLLPALWLTLLLPGTRLSPEAEARLNEAAGVLGAIAEWLPRRRLRSSNEEGTMLDPWVFLVGAVIIFAWIMVLFRTQRAALRMQGHGDTGSYALLIVPSIGWLRAFWVPFLITGIFVAVQAALLERSGQWAWLVQAVETNSPVTYAQAYWPQMARVFIALMVIWVPVGVMQVQRAAQEPLPFSTLGMGGLPLILLGLVFMVLSIPIAMAVVAGAGAVLHTAEGAPPSAPLYAYLAVQTVLLWFALSCASVAILDRRLHIIADRLEGVR
ncbi:MAG: hypothetical protein AAGH68_08195 [Pseudomonadota bacterium]